MNAADSCEPEEPLELAAAGAPGADKGGRPGRTRRPVPAAVLQAALSRSSDHQPGNFPAEAAFNTAEEANSRGVGQMDPSENRHKRTV